MVSPTTIFWQLHMRSLLLNGSLPSGENFLLAHSITILTTRQAVAGPPISFEIQRSSRSIGQLWRLFSSLLVLLPQCCLSRSPSSFVGQPIVGALFPFKCLASMCCLLMHDPKLLSSLDALVVYSDGNECLHIFFARFMDG